MALIFFGDHSMETSLMSFQTLLIGKSPVTSGNATGKRSFFGMHAADMFAKVAFVCEFLVTKIT